MATETQSATYQAFHERIHANHMYGLWELASQMTAHPTPKMVPYMWRWSLFESVLAEAGTVVPIGDERRGARRFQPRPRRRAGAAATGRGGHGGAHRRRAAGAAALQPRPRRALGDDEQHDRRHPDAAAGRDGDHA